MHEQARRLSQDDQVLVLEDDPRVELERRPGRRRIGQLDVVAVAQPVVRRALGAVDEHGAAVDQVLAVAPGRAVDALGQEAIEALARLLDRQRPGFHATTRTGRALANHAADTATLAMAIHCAGENPIRKPPRSSARASSTAKRKAA